MSSECLKRTLVRVVPLVMLVGIAVPAADASTSAPVGAGIGAPDVAVGDTAIAFTSGGITEASNSSSGYCHLPTATFGYEYGDGAMNIAWNGQQHCSDMFYTTVYAYVVQNGNIVGRAPVDKCTEIGFCTGGTSQDTQAYTNWTGSWYAVVDTVAESDYPAHWDPNNVPRGCTVTTTNNSNDTLSCRRQSTIVNL